jgi:hypothetical protein
MRRYSRVLSELLYFMPFNLRSSPCELMFDGLTYNTPNIQII